MSGLCSPALSAGCVGTGSAFVGYCLRAAAALAPEPPGEAFAVAFASCLALAIKPLPLLRGVVDSD